MGVKNDLTGSLFLYLSGTEQKGLSNTKRNILFSWHKYYGTFQKVQTITHRIHLVSFFVYFWILCSIVRLLLVIRPIPTVFKSKYINIDRYVWFISSIVKSISLRAVIIDFRTIYTGKNGLNDSLHSHISHSATFAMARSSPTVWSKIHTNYMFCLFDWLIFVN